ncbi:MAG: hypothetical protein ACI9EB_000465 [Pseudomonas sp.]|jgi:hypothetical protein
MQRILIFAAGVLAGASSLFYVLSNDFAPAKAQAASAITISSTSAAA